LVGYPNTGKTTLLNILARIKKSISKIPGTTLKITENNYNKNTKRKIYDMPGLYS
jgi:Fe2+ transport system protein B